MDKICADKILLSNNIFTGESKETFNGGIAVKGYHIIGVADREEIKKYIGKTTVVYDFGDKLLLPGFCDSHVHLLMGCMATRYADLGAGKSADDCTRILYEHYQANRDFFSAEEWVVGFNWYHFNWKDKSYPTKEALDKYFPDVPVFLMNSDCHGGWVNSKALEICGVDKNTPDVPYGTLHRDAEGNPTGYLEEMAASLCIEKAYDLPSVKEKMLLLTVNKYFSKYGVTSVGDMRPLLGANMGKESVYRQMADADELNFRINFAVDLFDDRDYILDVHKNFGNKEDLVYHNGLKQFMDGIIPAHTAIMLEPYTDDPNAPLSYELMDLTKARDLIEEYQGLGLNIQIHAVGDGAIRQIVDMYENAITKNGETEARLSVEHLDLTNPADVDRMAKLGIIGSVQPPHITLTDTLEENDYPPVVGEERTKNLWNYKSFTDKGMTLAFGTDYPVVGANPMIGLHRAVTRKFSDGKPEEGWLPEQKLDIFQAVSAYTLGGAKKFGKEKVLGTLTEGKLADIIALDKNLFAIEPDEILNTNVVFTMVDGRVVYTK